MKKKGLFVAAGAVSAAAVGATYAVTKILVKTALDREQPSIMKNSGELIAGSKREDEFVRIYTEAEERLKGSKHKEISIRARDGIKLVGHYFPSKNPERLIIAFHGWRSSWARDYGMISNFWHKNNCSVIYVEQRGQNNSGGEYMGFGLTERYDCIQWANAADELCEGKLPIYLAGISMGASTVLMAADLDLPNSVCGIMADCGFTSPKAIWKYVANNNLHISYKIPGMLADAFCKKKILMNSDSYSTVKALKNTKIPVFLVHGTDDKFVPIEMTYENYKACVSPKRLLTVPGADHAMSYYTDRAGYEKAELDFWKEFDFKKVGKEEE